MKTAEEILRNHFPPPKNEGEKNDDEHILNAMKEYATEAELSKRVQSS